MTEDEIKGLFYSYGQYVSGKDYALIRAIEQVVASQRQFVDLTDDEMLMIYGQQHDGKKYSLGRMVQEKIKEKNGC